MSFGEQIDQMLLQDPRAYDVTLSRDVIEEALQEKQHGSGVSLPEISLDRLSPEDKRLFETRVIGGILTRVAIGSQALKELGEIPESFLDLSAQVRAEVRDELGEAYAKRAAVLLNHVDDSEVEDLIGPGFVFEQADPLRSIPHSFVRHHIAQTKRRELTGKERLKQLLAYANVVPGTFPPDGFPDRTIGQNDAVLVQAFGRNSIQDKELPEVDRLHRTSEDDVETFVQLQIDGFDPGESNRALAKVIMRRELSEGAVIEPVVQWEVAYAMWEMNPLKYAAYSHYIHTVWPQSGFYPTFEVKADSIKTMDELGLYNPKEFAHRDMMVRALGILAKQGVEADPLVGRIPFDSLSVQAQARGPVPWTIRETLTRGEHILRGRVKF